MKVTQYTLDFGPNGYIVAYNDYPPGTKFDVDKALAGSRDGAVASTPGAI